MDVVPERRMVLEPQTSAYNSEDTRTHILADQVLPRIISHDGSLVIHAGAVRHDDGCIVFVGGSGFGKSSLTASFDQAGQALMGDDALIVSSAGESWRARAIYPSLRLFPDSVQAVLPESANTGSVARYTAKLRVDVPLRANSEHDKPLPIKAIFVLAGPGQPNAIEVRRITPATTCIALVKNSFALDPTDMQCARKRLENASDVSTSVPAYHLAYPHDYDRLAQVREAILTALTVHSERPS